MSSLSNSLDQTDRALLIHPYSNLVAHEQAGPLIISRGDGVRVYDVGGKEYIEGLGGLWSASLGFSEREIAEAVYEQMVQLPFYHGFHSKSTPSLIKLAHHLAEISPIPDAKFFFANSGSEINDTVIKCIWYANNVAGYPAKKKIITRNCSYHGVTIATASMTGLAANHSDFDLPIDRFLKVMCPDFYREGLEGESEEQFSDRCVAEVRDLIEREGADTIAAFVADPVIAGGGVLPPPKGYFEKLQPLLKENKILFVADEVICGFGRTGNMFATETYNLRPDIVTVAKALTASYIPMSAAMIAPSVWQPIVEGSRKHSVFAHGYTYSGHPVAAAAALKTLEIMEKRNIIGHVKTVAKVFASRLESYRGHPLVGDVRHVGLIGGIELVSNKATKAPFPVEVGTGAHCLRAAHKHGVILRSIGDIVAFCPPLIISEDEVDEMFSRFDRALDDTHAMLKGKEPSMSAYRELALFINGEWEVSTSGSLLPVVNPATGEAIGSLPVATIEQIDSAVKSASRAFAEWRRAPATERRNVLRRAAEILREKAETVAYRLTLEQGKPVAQARLEVTRVCDIFEYYAEEATRLCERSFPARPDGIQHQLVPEPVGVIAAFTAWNFPLVLAGRKLAMALAAGCSVVLKASEETPASAMALVEALDDAGLPKGVVNLLFGRPAEIAERLIGAPEVRKISLTGSIRVGKQIAENAGRYLKPCSLELGGHCPVLIFPDVDIEDTVDKLVSAKFANAGQICTSPSRFMIHADIYDRFVDVFLRRTEQLQLGNGIDCVTQVGPLANERGLRSIEEYVDSARRAGARILCGGAKADRPGYFYRPTVMVDLPSDARVMQEEYFGPLAPMVRFKHEDEAVKLANSLPYGLAAYVFTRDEVRSKRLVQSIEAGGVFINTAVTLSEYTPFCGVKESGYGYEGGREGLETFVHYKLVNRVTCDG